VDETTLTKDELGDIMKYHARSLLSVCVLVGVLGLAGDASASVCNGSLCPTIGLVGVYSADPTYCEYDDGTGYTADGDVYVGAWDPTISNWSNGVWVTADSSGNIANGNFSMPCGNLDEQWLLAYDNSTGSTAGIWYIKNPGCTGGAR
jgi:hypothetical protein